MSVNRPTSGGGEDGAGGLLDEGAGGGWELGSRAGLEVAADDRQREVDGGEEDAVDRLGLAELGCARLERFGECAPIGGGAAASRWCPICSASPTSASSSG